MHFFHIFTFQMYYLAYTASASINVKPDVSQSKAMFHNDVGFATVSNFDAIQADIALYSSAHQNVCCIAVGFLCVGMSVIEDVLSRYIEVRAIRWSMVAGSNSELG